MNTDYLSRAELERQGFADLGDDVLLHPTCVIVNAARISIGSHVRIDPFCIITISDRLAIGSRVHISGQAAILGGGRIEIGDFACLSHGVKVLSSSDAFTEAGIAGPMVPEAFRAVVHAPITIGRHVVLGAQTVVLPGVRIGEGATIGALSLVKHEIAPWTVNAGVPTRVIASRDRSRVLALERRFTEQPDGGNGR